MFTRAEPGITVMSRVFEVNSTASPAFTGAEPFGPTTLNKNVPGMTPPGGPVGPVGPVGPTDIGSCMRASSLEPMMNSARVKSLRTFLILSLTAKMSLMVGGSGGVTPGRVPRMYCSFSPSALMMWLRPSSGHGDGCQDQVDRVFAFQGNERSYVRKIGLGHIPHLPLMV